MDKHDDCSYCFKDDVDSRYLMMERIYISGSDENKNYALTDDDEIIPDFSINFCPMCGRKLESEGEAKYGKAYDK